MKVLLIMPLSYGYCDAIISVLKERGDSVFFIPDFDESLIKRLLRKFVSIGFIQNYYIRRKINKIKDDNFDAVLLVRGYCYSFSTINWIKESFIKSKFVLYQWDPISISKFDESAFSLFDRIFSFDKSDCNKYGMNYLPLFFKDSLNKKSIYLEESKTKIREFQSFDFSFVGSGHSQRLFVLGKLIDILRKRHYSYYIRVYINRFEFYRGLFFNRLGYRKFPREYLTFKPVSKKVADDIMMQTRVVIDIHHPQQTGLSIRIMEVLGAGKSIITTNKSILDEPFFDPNIIGFIENCQLPSNIDSLIVNNKEADVRKYEIHNWVNILLSPLG